MKMRKALLPFTFISLSLLLFPMTSAGGNYIIIRANVNPMYIENEPIQIQAFIIVFRNNKPTDESATLHVEMKGINVNYSYSEDFTISGGRKATYALPSLKEGHYRITIFAQKGGINSQKIAFEIGVAKAPVPYSAHFSSDGKKFYFQSLRLNETGQIDPDFPFTIKLYSWIPPNSATLIRTIKNVTEITISIPSSIRKSGGIAIVDVIDRWGWKNSATMDLSSFSFAGISAMYDYGYKYREPFWSRRLSMLFASILVIVVAIAAIFFFVRWYNA
ncbi:MAG TPA: hypothetical protein ENI53_01380 [Thermoplasmatales archaeon]|nr:hypothetical protein [Thermoplasmatales archaeon]